MKRIFSFCLIFIISMGLVLPVNAAATDTYTRVDVPGGSTELRLSREMYTAECTITASTLGIEESLDGITDVYCANDGTILLLCGGASRLIRINSDYTLRDELTIRDKNGNAIDFNGARGIYSDDEGLIYIADTNNARILICEENGMLIGTLNKPESDLIPDDFIYQPVSVTKDKQGYTYILSLGCYYGALLYTPDNAFLGFYGANTVESNVLDTLSYLWEKLTSNDVKKAASTKKLPYSFVDFSFDADGYMVTCTDNTDAENSQSNGTGQIRKISPNGQNILYKRELKGGSKTSSDVNFLENEVVFQEETGSRVYRSQKLVSIAVSGDGFIFALDNTNGLIYIYDNECNLMAAFGGGLGVGNQTGLFKTPVSLAVSGMSLFVADYAAQSITVFQPTEYGALFRSAQSSYLEGDYSEAKETWEHVLNQDSGNQLALRGLAMVYYNEGNYKTALEYAKNSYDYAVYDLAWQAVLSEWIGKHFVGLLIGILLLMAIIVTIIIVFRKREKQFISNQNMRVMLSTPFHPFESYNNLKYFGKSSWPIAIVLTFLFYVGSVLKNTASGFLYTDITVSNYNSIFTLASTAGLLILWSVCNWLVCSMLGGIGKFKEVYVATAYALMPMIVYSFIRVLASNVLPLSMSGLIEGIGTVILLYTFFLLCVGLIIVHEYDFFKVLWTGLLTICLMLLVVFVLFMCAVLLKQFGTFVISIYEEIIYR